MQMIKIMKKLEIQKRETAGGGAEQAAVFIRRGKLQVKHRVIHMRNIYSSRAAKYIVLVSSLQYVHVQSSYHKVYYVLQYIWVFQLSLCSKYAQSHY